MNRELFAQLWQMVLPILAIYFAYKIVQNHRLTGLGWLDSIIAGLGDVIVVIGFGGIILLIGLDWGFQRVENFTPQSNTLQLIWKLDDTVAASIAGNDSSFWVTTDQGQPAQIQIQPAQPAQVQVQPAPAQAPVQPTTQIQPAQKSLKDRPLQYFWGPFQDRLELGIDNPSMLSKLTSSVLPQGVKLTISLEGRGILWKKAEVWMLNLIYGQENYSIQIDGDVARRIGGNPKAVKVIVGSGLWPDSAYDIVAPAAPAEAPAPAEVPAAPAAPAPAEVPAAPAAPAEVLWVGTVSTPDGALNCRKEAIVQDGNIVTVLNNGEEIQVLSDDTLGWGEIRNSEGQQCFVALRFLEKTVKQ